MNEEKQLIIHFLDGTKMQVSFPAQIKGSIAALAELSKTVLQSDKLVIQTGEQILIIPWSSVRYAEAAHLPSVALPFGTIKGATMAMSGQ